jgi:hypothetical protein
MFEKSEVFEHGEKEKIVAEIVEAMLKPVREALSTIKL